MKNTRHLLLIACFFVASFFTTQTYGQTITTIAGGIGDGLPGATHGRLGISSQIGAGPVAFDNVDNLYFGDLNRLRKISLTTGIISTVAGNGSAGTGLVTGVATDVRIGSPRGIICDGLGNAYLSFYSTILKLNTLGNLSVVVGSSAGYSGDGSPASSAQIANPVGMAFDAAGNLYIADAGNSRVRKIDASGIITTVAGGGSVLGDGGPAVAASVPGPFAVTFDAAGNLYIASSDYRIRKVNTSGIITTIAGTGAFSGTLGDGGPATAAQVNATDIKIDNAGNIYISQDWGERIRKINATTGIITTIAGNGVAAYAGDGGPASAAVLNGPSAISFDNAGNLYITDRDNNRIRKINTSGIISTVTGALPINGFGGDGGPSLPGIFSNLNQITTDNAGNIYVIDAGNYRIREISSSGIVTTVAGNGISGFFGDGGPATAASFIQARDVAVDRMGNMYIADGGSNRVRKINTAGVITTIAGGGGVFGDGGPATAAAISVVSTSVDDIGNIYIADSVNHRIRKIDVASGIINTIAGDGGTTYSGDGIAATLASLGLPKIVRTDKNGNVYVLDGNRIRKINSAGIITTIAGTGTTGAIIEGVPATSSPINANNIIVDKWGSVFLACSTSVSKIDRYGYIHTVAGQNQQGYMGDGRPALSAQLWSTTGITADTLGSIYLSDPYYNTVRKVCCFNGNADQPPLFTHSSPAPLPLCTSTGTASIDTLLTLNDGDTGDTLKWTVAAAPMHGTLGGFPTTSLSTGSIVTPSGLSYTATTGYSGNDNFKIQVTDGTDISFITVQVTITAPPATSVSGPGAVCASDSMVLTGIPAGGTWSATNSNATVNATGKVFGMVAGTDTIQYTVMNGCGSTVASRIMTINPLAVTGSITGPSVVCVGSSISLSNTVSGGSWSCVSPYLSINNASGIVVGYAPGTAVITYTKTNSCGTATTTTNITVSGATWPGTISGGTTICTGGTTTLSTSVTGGTWSSGNTAIASVGTSGIVTGNAVGATIISYDVAGACGNATAITIVNVSGATPINPITGASSVCSGNTTTLTNSSPGGTWSSSSPLIASVSSTGVVTGLSQGITAISYIANLGCGTSVATFNMVVNAAPNAGTITNPATLCVGATAIASSYATGGTWSVNNANASVGPTGILTGLVAGSNTITYTVTNSCGTAITTSTINIYPAPNAGTISGSSTICAGTNTTLTNTVSSGSWSSSNIAVAVIGSATGILSGISGGAVNITYTDATGCGMTIATKAVTVNAPNAGVISGAASVCPGGSSTLSSSVAGGTWSSSAPSVATINTSGVASALAAGAAVISYTTTSSCGTAVATMLFNVGSLPVVSPVTGASNICASSSTTLSDATIGGAWSSNNPSVATINSSGVLTGIAAGTATISYVVTAGCGTAGATYAVVIDTLPSVPTINGADTLCTFGSTAFTASTAGGYWSSSNTAVLSITGPSGAASGVSTGVALVSYSVSNVCGTTTATKNTVVTAADAGVITGTTSICSGNTTTLTGTMPGGTWTSSNTAVATVDAYGVVNTLSAGISVISYATTGLCGTATATTSLIVGILPVVTPITGTDKICEGSTTTLSNATLGGAWSSSNTSVANVSGAGVVTGIAKGSATMSYAVTAGCGTSLTIMNMQIESDPTPAVISGNPSICIGTSTLLTANMPGGTWISGSVAIASVDPVSGVVAGISEGSTPITYITGNTCSKVSTTIPVYIRTKLKSSINGTTDICNGRTTTLGGSPAGGIWSIDNSPVANITAASGNVTTVQGYTAGTVAVSYKVSNMCGDTYARTTVAVHATPYIEPISGTTMVVANRTITLTEAVYGGVWSSSDNTVATVNNAGEVTGIKEGIATISYTITNDAGCDTFTTKSITVKKQERGLSAMFWLNPNPAKNLLTLSWENQYARYADVAITDMLGRFVYSTIIDMPHDSGKTELDVTNLVPAIYNINIKYAGDFFSTKLVIVK